MEMRTDDGLGRTRDWLCTHDPTKLVAGMAQRTRPVVGVSPTHLPVHPTSFSIRGEDAPVKTAVRDAQGTAEAASPASALLPITDGSSRDHRQDLTPWMLALATTQDGTRPLWLPPRSGNASDTVRVWAAVQAI
jgi:hypothetical protein